jgi:hypothetical protein
MAGKGLSAAEQHVLLALAAGWVLKSHRDLDGTKQYVLHPLDEQEPQPVSWETMDRLREAGLVDSNKKFPAATYLLTDRGKEVASRLGGGDDTLPLTASGWS